MGGDFAGPTPAAVTAEFIDVALPGLIGNNDHPRLRVLTARLNRRDGFISTHPPQG